MSDEQKPGGRNVGLSAGLGAWVPMHERAPEPDTTCVVWLRYDLSGPGFASVDEWRMHREDPTGMGGPTIEMDYDWADNDCNDVIAWIALPAPPPKEWDEREAWQDDVAPNAQVNAPLAHEVKHDEHN